MEDVLGQVADSKGGTYACGYGESRGVDGAGQAVGAHVILVRPGVSWGRDLRPSWTVGELRFYSGTKAGRAHGRDGDALCSVKASSPSFDLCRTRGGLGIDRGGVGLTKLASALHHWGQRCSIQRTMTKRVKGCLNALDDMALMRDGLCQRFPQRLHEGSRFGFVGHQYLHAVSKAVGRYVGAFHAGFAQPCPQDCTKCNRRHAPAIGEHDSCDGTSRVSVASHGRDSRSVGVGTNGDTSTSRRPERGLGCLLSGGELCGWARATRRD